MPAAKDFSDIEWDPPIVVPKGSRAPIFEILPEEDPTKEERNILNFFSHAIGNVQLACGRCRRDPSRSNYHVSTNAADAIAHLKSHLEEHLRAPTIAEYKHARQNDLVPRDKIDLLRAGILQARSCYECLRPTLDLASDGATPLCWSCRKADAS